jgi:hypothetical protein|nr:MAG TPA: hypothetical protein [Caudoviricetes sp.]
MKLKEMAIGGLALTILGTFCPLITMPIMGSSNFYTGGGIKSIDGLIFIVLCAWIGYDIYKENFLSLRWKSILLFVDILISTFFNYIRIDNIKAKYLKEIEGNPFAELGKGIMNSVGLSWGWGVMIIGACILLYAAFKLYNGEDE